LSFAIVDLEPTAEKEHEQSHQARLSDLPEIKRFLLSQHHVCRQGKAVGFLELFYVPRAAMFFGRFVYIFPLHLEACFICCSSRPSLSLSLMLQSLFDDRSIRLPAVCLFTISAAVVSFLFSVAT
jgi:hypothetical protein